MFFFGRRKKQIEKPFSEANAPRPELNEGVSPRRPSPEMGVDEVSAEAQAEILQRRKRRANAPKTRLVGYDASDERVIDLFEEEQPDAESTGRSKFPVALVVVIEGPGHGEAFTIQSGMSQIGRGEDQAIRLDFGDTAISRTNHAAIVYDPETHTFLLGHGGKANIVRLNGKPVVSTKDISDGDTLEIGETKMRFVAICSPTFNWSKSEEEDEGSDDDVAIA